MTVDNFEDSERFIKAALRHVLSESLVENSPTYCTAHLGDAGLMVFYCPDYVSWKSTVQADVPVTTGLLQTIEQINEQLPMGQLTVSSNDEAVALVVWRYKILPRWLDTESRGSANLLLDVTSNAATMVRMCRERLAVHGGVPYTPENLDTLLFI